MLALPRHVVGSPAPANAEYLLPALLSIVRIPLGFLLVLTTLRPVSIVVPLPLIILFIAYATDIADGWLARRWHVQSTIGRNLDVFCDRVLHYAGFGVVAVYGAPLIALVALVLRDFLITSIRVVAGHQIRTTVKHQRYLSLGHAGIVRLWLALCLIVGPGKTTQVLAFNPLLELAMLTGYISVAWTLVVTLSNRNLWIHNQ